MSNGAIYSLRKMHGYLFEKKNHLKNKLKWRKYLTLPFGKKVYLVGTPEHTNIGDSAIVLAEIFFINKSISANRVKEITVQEYQKNRHLISSCINKKYLVCGHGGGNIGNQWYAEELLRYDYLYDFSNNNTVIFPQTIYFTSDEEGIDAKEKSRFHYNAHNNLTIVAREHKSFELLNDLYSNPAKIITPDIVLSSTMDDYGIINTSRNGVLLVFRNDKEKAMSDSDRNLIIEGFEKEKIRFKITDMHSECPITKKNRFDCVRKKLQEFVQSNLVITDRLHGMVFAAITGTPCIVLSNYNHKVKGTYEWIKYLPYIKYAENVSDVEKYIPELLAMDNCKYDNTPLKPYFDKLAEVVKSKC